MPFESPSGITSDQVVTCIESFVYQRGYPPTVRELASCLDIGTTSAHYWLNKLVKEGRIRRGEGSRAITIL
jgi:hypothetical protein